MRSRRRRPKARGGRVVRPPPSPARAASMPQGAAGRAPPPLLLGRVITHRDQLGASRRVLADLASRLRPKADSSGHLFLGPGRLISSASGP